MDDHMEERTGERLRAALHEEARMAPLSEDFASEAVSLFPDRRARQRFALPAVAAIVVLAVAVAVAVVVSSFVRSPVSTGPPSSAFSTSAGSPSSGQLTQYTSDTLTFDYPSGWRIIEEGINARHYQWIPVIIGTGDWQLNCQAIPPSGDSLGGVTCGQDIFTIGPGQVVVEFYTWQGPFGQAQTPPPTAFELPNGLAATLEDGTGSSIWKIYVPGWLGPLVVEARFADPGGEAIRADVRRIVESVVVLPRSNE